MPLFSINIIVFYYNIKNIFFNKYILTIEINILLFFI